MSSKSKKDSFIIQGSILAMAGILVRVIGLIYRIPLNRILGDVGLGYYGTGVLQCVDFVIITKYAISRIKDSI